MPLGRMSKAGFAPITHWGFYGQWFFPIYTRYSTATRGLAVIASHVPEPLAQLRYHMERAPCAGFVKAYLPLARRHCYTWCYSLLGAALGTEVAQWQVFQEVELGFGKHVWAQSGWAGLHLIRRDTAVVCRVSVRVPGAMGGNLME